MGKERQTGEKDYELQDYSPWGWTGAYRRVSRSRAPARQACPDWVLFGRDPRTSPRKPSAISPSDLIWISSVHPT